MVVDFLDIKVKKALPRGPRGYVPLARSLALGFRGVFRTQILSDTAIDFLICL